MSEVLRLLRAPVELLVVVFLGALGGALVGVVIVDYTDAYASHTAIDLAVVGVCAAAGLALGLLAHRSRAASEPPDRQR